MSAGQKWMNFISLCIVLLLLVAFTLATSNNDLDKNGRSLPFIRTRRSPCQGRNCHSNRRRSETPSFHHRAKVNRRSKRGCQSKSSGIQGTPDSSKAQQDGNQMAQRLQAVEKAMAAEQSLMGGAEWTKKMLQQNGQGSTVEYTEDFQWSNASGGMTQPQLTTDTSHDKEQDASQAAKEADDEKKKQDYQREQESKADEEKKKKKADEQKKEEDEKAREIQVSEKEKADEKKNEEEQQKAKEAEEDQEKQKEKSEEDAKNAQKDEADRQAAQAAEQAKENESKKTDEKADQQPNKNINFLTSTKPPPAQSSSSASSSSASNDAQSQQSSNSAQFSSFEKFKHSTHEGEADSVRWVDLHNNIRARYYTGPVRWDDKLAQYAQGVANTCVFEHSHGSYGENIAAGETDLAQVVNDWAYGTDESKSYDPAHPLYSHFTQLIWKGTTRIGCAVKDCANIANVPWTGDSKYWVCSYDPPGNYIGEFIANVKCAKGGQPLAK